MCTQPGALRRSCFFLSEGSPRSQRGPGRGPRAGRLPHGAPRRSVGSAFGEKSTSLYSDGTSHTHRRRPRHLQDGTAGDGGEISTGARGTPVPGREQCPPTERGRPGAGGHTLTLTPLRPRRWHANPLAWISGITFLKNKTWCEEEKGNLSRRHDRLYPSYIVNWQLRHSRGPLMPYLVPKIK